MSRLGWATAAVALGLGGVVVAGPFAAADVGSGTGGAITIPAGAPGVTAGPSDPYPSTITLSGVGGTIVDVQVGLNGFAHTFLDDLVIVLEAPDGDTVALVNQCGGADDAFGVDVVFADGGIPWADGTSGGALSPNTYAPSTCAAGALDAPGPAGPYGTTFASLAGGAPNGDWHLWVFDDTDDDVGAMTSWSLDVTTTNSAPFAGDAAFSTPVGIPLTASLAPFASDVDDDSPLTFAEASAPASGTLDLDPDGAFTYTPAPGFTGTITFIYTVDDGVPPDDVSQPGTVTITVNPAQVTTTTTTTAPSTTTTTAATTTTTARAVLARTGVDRSATARGGAASVVIGALLIGASTAMVNRSRRWRHRAR
jgi:subtilisin-like proprotein convertase family protein